MTESGKAQTPSEKRSRSDRGSRLFWATIGGSILALLLICAVLVIVTAQGSS